MDNKVVQWVTRSTPLESKGTWKKFVQERKGFDDGGRVKFGSGTPFAITDEKLAKIDNLIKNTDLDLKAIGKQIGFGTDKKPMDSTSKVFREYVKKYGEPNKIRLQTRGVKLTADSPYVKKVIKLRKELGSTEAVAKELGKERKTIRNVLKQFAPKYIKPANIPNPDGPYDYSKVRVKTIEEMKKVLKKMPGGKKTLDQTISLMDKINAQNKVIATMTDKEILRNKKLIDSMRLDVTELKTSKPRLKFDRYKDFTDEQLVKKIRDLAETNQLFQVEHQIPISSKRTASLFPKNIQVAVGRVGGQMETLKKFVINNPDSPVVKDIDKFLKSQNVQVKGVGDKNIGYADDIIFDTKKGQSKIVEKGLAKQMKAQGFKCTVTKANGGPASCNNPRAYLDDIAKQREIARTGSGKQAINAARKLKGLKTFMTSTLGPAAIAGEIAFAVPFALSDYASGESTSRIINNATFGLAGDSVRDEIVKYGGEEAGFAFDAQERGEKLEQVESQADLFMGPDDSMLYPDQLKGATQRFEKSIEPFIKTDPSLPPGIGERYFDSEMANQYFNKLFKAQDDIADKKAILKQERKVEPEDYYGFGAAGGGIATLDPRRPNAIPPKSGPMPQGGGLSSQFNRVRKVLGV
jgi:hypothetical protein